MGSGDPCVVVIHAGNPLPTYRSRLIAGQFSFSYLKSSTLAGV